MIALVFGDENMAKPIPMMRSIATITAALVSGPTNMRPVMPAPLTAMPAEDSLKGEIRSDSLPILGESSAIATGWHTIMNPAVWDDKAACDYCPYKGVCGFDPSIDGYEYRG